MTRFSFVACINRPEVARDCLLASPCLAPAQGHQVILAQGMNSAGEGYQRAAILARHEWIVMLHQDVFLPEGWDLQMTQSLQQARHQWPKLTVAGVYGVRADGSHVGHVHDRDRWLGQPLQAPERVRSLDELLLVLRRDATLAIHPALGWHLYGTDLCLQAEALGRTACVVHAPCEHRSSLPRSLQVHTADAAATALQAQVDAFNASATVLLQRWPAAVPVTTPVATIQAGFRLQLVAS